MKANHHQAAKTKKICWKKAKQQNQDLKKKKKKETKMEARERNETEVPVFPRMINHSPGFLSSGRGAKVRVAFGGASLFGCWKNVF